MQKAYATILLILLSFINAAGDNKPQLPDTIKTNSGGIYVIVNKQDHTPVFKDTLMAGKNEYLLNEPAMADVLYSNGKIYVVVLVLATIFAGIIVLLARMNSKITRLEKNKQ